MLCLGSRSASAEIIFYNLGTPITGAAEVLGAAAQPFQTDSESYFFNSVQVNLKYNPGGNDPVQIYLFSNGQFTPGNQIEQLNGPSLINADGLFTYSGTASLNPNTTYWIVAESVGAGTAYSLERFRRAI